VRGANGEFFRSDVTLYNDGDFGTDLLVVFLGRGATGEPPAFVIENLGAGSTTSSTARAGAAFSMQQQALPREQTFGDEGMAVIMTLRDGFENGVPPFIAAPTIAPATAGSSWRRRNSRTTSFRGSNG